MPTGLDLRSLEAIQKRSRELPYKYTGRHSVDVYAVTGVNTPQQLRARSMDCPPHFQVARPLPRDGTVWHRYANGSYSVALVVHLQDNHHI